MCTIYNPLFLSNNILERAYRDDVNITPMKLQKLLYFTYRDYIKKTEKSLFAERFETWRYGPVLSTVYQGFKRYSDKHIKHYYKDENGKTFKVNENLNPDLNNVLNTVWFKYKDEDGIELSKRTHEAGTAWYKARMNGLDFLRDEDIISETNF